MKNLQFAILECRGYERRSPPEERHIKEILESFLLERGWKLACVAYIKDIATLVGITSDEKAPVDLSKTIADFKNFVGTKFDSRNMTKAELEARNREGYYPMVHLGSNVTIGALMDSTEQDGRVFANQVVTLQLEKIQKEFEEVEKNFSDFAEKFKNF